MCHRIMYYNIHRSTRRRSRGIVLIDPQRSMLDRSDRSKAVKRLGWCVWLCAGGHLA
jgi:hypothetical protein